MWVSLLYYGIILQNMCSVYKHCGCVLCTVCGVCVVLTMNTLCTVFLDTFCDNDVAVKKVACCLHCRQIFLMNKSVLVSTKKLFDIFPSSFTPTIKMKRAKKSGCYKFVQNLPGFEIEKTPNFSILFPVVIILAFSQC